MIFITCQKHDILPCDITKKSCIVEYTNMVKSRSAPNGQNRKNRLCDNKIPTIP